MTEKARRCLDFVLAREGGLSDHPADPGGRTFKGISERAHPDAWKDGPPSDEAVDAIYLAEYWTPIQGERLAEPLALALLDYAVHSGTKRARRELAVLIGLPRDADMGDIIEAVRTLPDPKGVALQLIIERALFLVRRALAVPGQSIFLVGWMTRIRELKRAVEAAPGG